MISSVSRFAPTKATLVVFGAATSTTASCSACRRNSTRTSPSPHIAIQRFPSSSSAQAVRRRPSNAQEFAPATDRARGRVVVADPHGPGSRVDAVQTPPSGVNARPLDSPRSSSMTTISPSASIRTRTSLMGAVVEREAAHQEASGRIAAAVVQAAGGAFGDAPAAPGLTAPVEATVYSRRAPATSSSPSRDVTTAPAVPGTCSTVSSLMPASVIVPACAPPRR